MLGYLRQIVLLAQNKKTEATQVTLPITLTETNTIKIINQMISGTTENSVLPDGQMLDKLEPFWLLLAQMKQDNSVTPVSEFQQIINKGSYKKNISSILDYYNGVAAMRLGKKDMARTAWLKAKNNGFMETHLTLNQDYLLLEQLVILAEEEKWYELINAINSLPNKTKELEIVKELAGFACYYIGYQAAQEGKWEIATRYWRRASEQNNSCRLSQNLALAEEALENWVAAAAAWREMLKRRSRKATSANHLTDSQVAAIWKRAAECYKKTRDIDNIEEHTTCLKNALKYAENDLELRIDIVDTLRANDQEKAASNELKRILAIAPNNIDALLRLGEMASNKYDIDEAIDIWKQILAIDPKHKDAKEALASDYVKKAEHITPTRKRISFLEDTLKQLPEHPKLLLLLAKATDYVQTGKSVIEIFLRAYKAAIKDIELVSEIFHELVHIKEASAEIEKIMAEINQRPGLMPDFWISQGHGALQCQLGIEWGQVFFDEAIKLSEETKIKSKADVFLEVFLAMHVKKLPLQQLNVLRTYYLQRIQSELPDKGLLEYVAAFDAFHDKKDVKEAQRLFKEARQRANKANEPALVEKIKETEENISHSSKRSDFLDDVPVDVLMRLMARFPDGPPKSLDKLSKQDMKDFEALMELMGGLPDEIF